MTTKLVTHSLKTGELTALSNISSINVTGRQVSILEDQPHEEGKDSSTIHLTFDVTHPQKLPSLLSTAEELGLIMKREDAIELGLSILSMAMEDKTSGEVENIKQRLSAMIEELH